MNHVYGFIRYFLIEQVLFSHISCIFIHIRKTLNCKAFFRRVTRSEIKVKTGCDGKCDIFGKVRSHCKQCRYQRCLNVGMDPTNILNEENWEASPEEGPSLPVAVGRLPLRQDERVGRRRGHRRQITAVPPLLRRRRLCDRFLCVVIIPLPLSMMLD